MEMGPTAVIAATSHSQPGVRAFVLNARAGQVRRWA
jgi:hypothetical protein